MYYIGVSKDSDFSTPDGVRLGTDLDTLKSIYGKEDYYRLVVGTTREAIDEYLKLKEPPA